MLTTFKTFDWKSMKIYKLSIEGDIQFKSQKIQYLRIVSKITRKVETKQDIICLLWANPKCSKNKPITTSQPWGEWNPMHKSVSKRMKKAFVVSFML